MRDAEDAPYTAYASHVVGAYVVRGHDPRSAVVFFGTKFESEAVAIALNRLAWASAQLADGTPRCEYSVAGSQARVYRCTERTGHDGLHHLNRSEMDL